jgi:hypothetical protein
MGRLALEQPGKKETGDEKGEAKEGHKGYENHPDELEFRLNSKLIYMLN